MSWFNQGNTISERDLIAYHLHELSPRREREVARALERSASLTAVSTSIETTLRAVRDTPKPIDQAAFTRTWAALQPALTPYAIPLPAKPRWQSPAFAKVALASLAIVGLGVVAIKLHGPSSNVPALATSTVESTTTTSNAPQNIARLPSVPPARPDPSTQSLSTATFRTLLPRPAGPPPIHPLTLSPTSSNPQTSSGELRPRKQDESTALLLKPPGLPTGINDQTCTAAIGGAGKKHRELTPALYRTDVMFAVGGTFTPTHASLTGGTEPRTVAATAAIAAIGALHQQFRSAIGYRVTLSYTRPDFLYTSATGTGSGAFHSEGNINSRIFEAAGTYVIQGPHRGRLTTAADTGFALMAFLPTQDPAARYVYRGAGVLGASADYTFGRHWAARANYRAQFFRSPDFRYLGYAVPVTASRVISHESSVGIVYRFGKTQSRP